MIYNQNLRFALTKICFLLCCSFATGQNTDTKWYSENKKNGIVIQNSFPKGGPYTGPTNAHFNYSYLVFFTRIVNETEHLIELKIRFSADSIAIPNSPNTFVKVFLPPDTMTLDKQHVFSYGITRLASFDKPTSFNSIIPPGEDALFYTAAIFYQTTDNFLSEERGGNRAEFIFDGKDLVFNMRPQIDSLPCGHIIFKK
ncbi:MAG: hypothetical protein AAGF96_15205 [Bacteroidota bacterium]